MLAKIPNEHSVLFCRTFIEIKSLAKSCTETFKQRFSAEILGQLSGKFFHFLLSTNNELGPRTDTTHYEGDHKPQVRSSQTM